MAKRGATHINATRSDRPSLKDLYDHVVNNVADKWKDLGVQLLRSDQENMLDIIEADHPHDVVSCCKCVLKKWLDTTTDATWNQLIRALRSPSVQLDYLAGQLEQMMTTQSAMTSKGTKPPCKNLMTIHDFELQFAKMTNKIKRALISNDADVVSLIEQLCVISAVRNKKVPLFDDDVFEKIKSIDEFWRRLRTYWNIFDYELLQYIVEISDCKKAQEIFKEFLSLCDFSAIEDVDLVSAYGVEDQDGLLKPVLRIKVNTDKCTLNIKKMVEEVVSKKFNLYLYTLHFQLGGIKEGCVEFCYYISKPLKLYLLQFEISQSIVADFLAYKIISFHIDEYELDITNETFTWCVQQKEDANAQLASYSALPLKDVKVSVHGRMRSVIIQAEIYSSVNISMLSILQAVEINGKHTLSLGGKSPNYNDAWFKEYEHVYTDKSGVPVNSGICFYECYKFPSHYIRWYCDQSAVDCEPNTSIPHSRYFQWKEPVGDLNCYRLVAYRGDPCMVTPAYLTFEGDQPMILPNADSAIKLLISPAKHPLAQTKSSAY